MQLKGKLTITMPTGPNPPVMRIMLKDEEAIEELKIEIGLEGFARCIGHEAFQPCTFEIPEHFGMVRETRTMTVSIPKRKEFGMDDTFAKELLEPFWENGWTGGILDLMNFKNRDCNGNGVVHLHRWRTREEIERAKKEAEEILGGGDPDSLLKMVKKMRKKDEP